MSFGGLSAGWTAFGVVVGHFFGSTACQRQAEPLETSTLVEEKDEELSEGHRLLRLRDGR